MLIKVILNKVYKFKNFVYGATRFERDSAGQNCLTVEIRKRRKSRSLCSKCRRRCAGYDTQRARDYSFIPIWDIPVFFRYARCRVRCPEHGVIVEWLPWTAGKSPLTHGFKIYLAQWARDLSWQRVAERFHVSWHNVFEAVQAVVTYGLHHRDLSGITAIGIDEIQYQNGHRYLTLVYQIDTDCRRLLYIGKERTEKTLRTFFTFFGKARCQALEVVCSDMWRPYLKVVASMVPNALHILDRFHIMKKFNEAIDQIRRREAKRLEQDGYEPVLNRTRWLLVKQKRNQSTSQLGRLRELLRYNLKTVKGYLLREAFQKFWTYKSPYWAEQFLNQWTRRAMYSKIDEMKKVARMLRRHQPLIMNWFQTKKRFSNGIVEGFNNKAKLTMRKSYGFRHEKTLEIALFHQLGNLPEPELTHNFL